MLSPMLYDFFGTKNDDFFNMFNAMEKALFSGHKNDLESLPRLNMTTDVVEQDDKYIMTTNLAGYNKDDINLALDNGYLTITATRKSDYDDDKYLIKERSYGEIRRSFYVGDNVTEDEINAKFENGVLTVDIPKKQLEEKDTKRLITID